MKAFLAACGLWASSVAGLSTRNAIDGNLTDGTAYSIRVPSNWAGILVNDLDAVSVISDEPDLLNLLLSKGWAYAGTDRRADRDYHFDPSAERDSQVEVLDIFTEKFGKPTYAVQYGCSGGGGVALGVAETYPDRFDGAVSANGGEGLVMSNHRLDLLFALKALLAPDSDLPLDNITLDDSEKAKSQWRKVLKKANTTDEGRAKILLAGAITQMSSWGGAYEPYLPKPRPDNETAVLDAMLRSTIDGAVYAAGIRYLYDNPSGVMSWNTGIEYKTFFQEADRHFKKRVMELYHKTGLSVAHDLDTIDFYPRLAENKTATSYWKKRALTGKIGVPVLQFSTIGDSSRSKALVSAYAEAVHLQEKDELYRTALVEAAGHCTSVDSEIVAAIDALIFRLRSGSWGGVTEPEVLNELGRSYMEGGHGPVRFISTDTLPKRHFRAYLPDVE